MEILCNIDSIDFPLMYTGKLCVDELSRVRRVVRMDCIKLPRFLHDIEKYKHFLHHMAYVNGLGPRPERRTSIGSRKGHKNGHKKKPFEGMTPTPSKHRHVSTKARRRSVGKSVAVRSSGVLLERSVEQQTTLVDPSVVYAGLPGGLHDEEEEAEDDDVATCPPDNNYAATSRLLTRPKSTPNKIVSPQEPPQNRIDWFGMLERKWDT